MEVLFEKEKLLPHVKKLASLKRGADAVKTEFLGGGSYGLVWAIEYADGVVEIIKAFKIGEMLNREAESLKLLKQASPLKVPEVFYIHNATEELPVNALCMERIEGVNALSCKWSRYSRKKRKFFAATVTDALFIIQQTTGERFGFIGRNERYDTWQEFYGKIAKETYEKAKEFLSDGKLPNYIFELLEKGIQNIDFLLEQSSKKPCLTHGDFYPMNIMADKKTLAPTGIIDPFESMWGDKEYDLWNPNGYSGRRYQLYKTYKRKFQTTERVDLKCAFYCLVNEVYHHIKSGWYPKKQYAELAKRVIKQYKKYRIIQ